jgi:RNA polymerase-interacting CarD/CdnL/TRCF family regulator
MFAVNEKVVYPGVGVACVNRVVEQSFAGVSTICYELKFLNKDMTILVPLNNLPAVGVRSLSSSDNIQRVFQILAEPQKRVPQELISVNWNKKYRKCRDLLFRGNLDEMSTMYRDLHTMAVHKELSFGEKTLLQQTEALLAQEISHVRNINEEKAVQELRLTCNKTIRKQSAELTL